MKTDKILEQERHKVAVSAMTYKSLHARSALPDAVEFCLTLPGYATADISLNGQLFHTGQLNALVGGTASLLVATLQKGSLELQGEGLFQTHHAGDVFLLDLSSAYQMRGQRCRLHCLMVKKAPHEPLAEDLLAKAPLALRRTDGVTLMLHQQLAGLRDCLRLTSMEEAKHLLPPLLHLVNYTAARTASLQENSESSNLARIRTFIETHLADPDLSADMICQNLGLSRASLYRLADPLGGIQKFITAERLKKAYSHLSQAHEKCTISNLAFDMGFNTETSFRRSFKEKYGVTPAKVRAQALHHN